MGFNYHHVPLPTAGGICPQPPTPVSDECLDEDNISVPIFMSLEADAVAEYSCPVGCFLNPSNPTSRTCILITLTEGFWSGETPSCTGEDTHTATQKTNTESIHIHTDNTHRGTQTIIIHMRKQITR